jgi:hypothetical protein
VAAGTGPARPATKGQWRGLASDGLTSDG